MARLTSGDRAAGLRVVMLDTLSGTNDVTVEWVQALVNTGPLTVFTVQGSRLQAASGLALRTPFPAFAAPRSALWKAWRTLSGYAQLLAWVLRAPRRTVVHVQFLRHERIEAWLLACMQRAGARVVATAHNALPHVRQPWHLHFYRRWYGQVDAVQVLSRAVQVQIESELQVRPRHLQRVGHGPYQSLRHRFAHLTRLEARRALGWPQDRFVLLQFGLFKPYKGLATLAAAVAQLPEALRPLVALAGGGPAEHLRAVRHSFERSGRSRDLLWHQRYADDATLCRMITAADLVVFPYESVSQSGALVLALSFAKPCLCSDLSGFREMLQPEQDALDPAQPLSLVRGGDPAEWAVAIARLMSDPRQLKALQAECEAAARHLPTWSDIATQTWQLWREVRSQAGPAVLQGAR